MATGWLLTAGNEENDNRVLRDSVKSREVCSMTRDCPLDIVGLEFGREAGT